MLDLCHRTVIICRDRPVIQPRIAECGIHMLMTQDGLHRQFAALSPFQTYVVAHPLVCKSSPRLGTIREDRGQALALTASTYGSRTSSFWMPAPCAFTTGNRRREAGTITTDNIRRQSTGLLNRKGSAREPLEGRRNMHLPQHGHESKVNWLLVAACLLVGLSACSTSPTEDPVERQFQQTLRARIGSKVVLQTDKEGYGRTQPIVYRVINQGPAPVYFSDYSYGLEAFKYDTRGKRWVRLRLGFEVDAQVTILQPGTSDRMSGVYGIGPEGIPDSGTIRLVVLGWDDPANPEGSRVAAFKDIEVEP